MRPPFTLLQKAGTPVFHLCAFFVAALLVFAFKLPRDDVQKLTGQIDNRYFEYFNPYFPGLANIGQHELFNPLYRNKKKILVLGASGADSIGCDASWSTADPTRDPSSNAHFSCSITGQLNELLRERGYGEWRAFNLARNGTALTPLLYAYSRAVEVKPDVVVWGEGFPYYKKDNADASALSPEMYAHMDAVFGASNVKPLWDGYREALARGRVDDKWSLPAYAPKLLPPVYVPDYRAKTSILDLVALGFSKVRDALHWDSPPHPVQLYPAYRSFTSSPTDNNPYVLPDPGLSYFQGFGLIGELQRQAGHTMAFYFLPQFDYRHRVNYLQTLDKGVMSQFLEQHGIGHQNLAALPLRPVLETYDGFHQTRAGNRILAEVILNDLINKHYVTRN